jgi:hypothetical protein
MSPHVPPFNHSGSQIAEGRSPDPLKLSRVTKLQPPKSPHQVRQVLGLFSYFRKFIPNYSVIANPIQALVVPTRKFESTEAAHTAFEKLKQIITSAPLLAHFDPRKEAILGTRVGPRPWWGPHAHAR